MPSAVRLDPRIFIGSPFRPCPSCGAAEFGTLMISNRTVTRRCRACWHTASQRLPAVHKKVIYLDQMVYSGMAKTLDPVWAATSGPQGAFPGQLFDALERAFKLQLIVCPSSTVHEKESALASQPTMLRAVYEHLGEGISFQYPVIIHQQQLAIAFGAVLRGQAPRYDLPRGHVLYGNPDEWLERIRVSVNLAGLLPERKVLRGAKDRSYAAMLRYFEQWRTETGKKFNDWHQQERRGHAVNFASLFNERLALIRHMMLGNAPMTEEVWNPRLEAEVAFVLMHVAQQAGHEKLEDALQVVGDFLFSDVAYDAPANDLSAMLMASVARKAASGQRRPPSPGMWNDITAIASFLPYCDAMFLDNECAGLLREEPLRTKIKAFGTAIFSSRSGDAFLHYLAGLERDAGAEHVKLVADVYGGDWSVPYRELLIHARARETRDGTP